MRCEDHAKAIWIAGTLMSILWFLGMADCAAEDKAKRFVNSLGMEFVRIEPGEFVMGSPEKGFYELQDPIQGLRRNPDEVQHTVVLTKPFYMQTTEVTQGQWKAVMRSNPSYFKECGNDCPVERVSWFTVQKFIQKLNEKKEGTYRLPTEAEWEYCARAGTTTPFSWGEVADCSRAMFLNKRTRRYEHEYCAPYIEERGMKRDSLAPVKSYAPNPWGLYDMHGNVWEWCEDWYGPYPEGRVVDPKGPSEGTQRVRRGGSWFGRASYCRSANRTRSHPASRYRTTGFRLVREYE